MGKKVVFTWGRFNPPTIGHGVVMDRVASEAKTRGADFKIFASKSEDPRKNPLSFKNKIKFLKKSFPKYSRNVDSNARLNTILSVMASLQKKYNEVTVIVGSDRVQEFNKLLHVYNGRDYNFDKIDVVSAGERDPDAEDVTGMSASKMRKAAADGDYKSFKKGTPIKNPKELYDTLRNSMQITEEFYSLMEDVHDINSVKGKRFNQLLRFGLAPNKFYSITIRAFKDMQKSGPNYELRKHIFGVAEKTLEYVMNDTLLYNRFLVLLNQDFLDAYQEEQRDALLDKSQKSGIDFTALLEVYMRGLASSPIYGKTPAQYAFDRVNSFIAGGHAQKKLDTDIWEECQLQESKGKKMKKFSQLDPFHKGPNTKKPAPEWGTKDMADRYSKVTPSQPDDIGEATKVGKRKVPVYEPIKGKKGHHKVVGHVSPSATSVGAAKVGKSRTAFRTMKLTSPEYPEGPGWIIKEDAMGRKKRFEEVTQNIEEQTELDEAITEARMGAILKNVKKGGPPYTIVAFKQGVAIDQERTEIAQAVPAFVREMKKKHSNVRVAVEDRSGRVLHHEEIEIEEDLGLGKVHFPDQKTVMAINRKLKADAPEVLKDYRKLLKKLNSSFSTGKEIVYIRDEPKESYRKKTGFGNAHRVVMRDRTSSPLGKEVVYHKGSMETTYDTVLAFKEEYLHEGVASRSRRAFSKIRTDTINQAADKNRKQKPIPTSVKKRVADDLARQKKFRQKNRQQEEEEIEEGGYTNPRTVKNVPTKDLGTVYNWYNSGSIAKKGLNDLQNKEKDSIGSELGKRARTGDDLAKKALQGRIHKNLDKYGKSTAPPMSKPKKKSFSSLFKREETEIEEAYKTPAEKKAERLAKIARAADTREKDQAKKKTKATAKHHRDSAKSRASHGYIKKDQFGRPLKDEVEEGGMGRKKKKASDFLKDVNEVYTYNTTKTSDGFKWSVVKVEHGKKPYPVVASGTAKTRAQAMGAAKKAQKKHSNK